MEQHLLNRLKTEDPEFEVTKGTELVLKTNSTFILNNCLVTFNLKEIKNFYLVSKNSYLIGVVVQPSLDNFVFFPSQTACNLAIINLIELCIYKLIKEDFQLKFQLHLKNINAINIVNFYFISDTDKLLNCNLNNLKHEKITQILKRYDQTIWI